MAEKLGHRGNLERWRRTARDIKDDILTRGWNSQRRAFTQHYDTLAMDASNLRMPLYGFLPISDERIMSTIERTVEELSLNGLLCRYSALYQRLLGYGNHVGLFSEMADPTSGEALGNFPQALTHLEVITTGLELLQATQGKNTAAGRSPA